MLGTGPLPGGQVIVESFISFRNELPIESQLFHVRVARALQRVHPRTSELRPECLQDRDVCEELVLHGLIQSVELWSEVIVKIDQRTFNYGSHGICSRNHNRSVWTIEGFDLSTAMPRPERLSMCWAGVP